ncbi:hypothetical protein NEI02_06460 [Brachyspira pilosicoli]|uniref:Lipoprotein n=1 Tax=Brachyspira pilosicoli TaxID=52584 RepID=A0AAJ6KBM4_BRAPL|nr:hypothetical protein [Brachyspira pilosicoli]WIH89346.1 hypothetical protein NEI02_06460 [Brachyspira pilosicoli]WIH91641.1 hypothetical protein NEI01_06460 [Brachyspira pilosicoli]WIH94547.1 hypothetical protein NEH99_09640 [Brachyspira pilosicoli]
MRKLIFLLLISILSISCIYEDDTTGVIINWQKEGIPNAEITLIQRKDNKSFRDIKAITYIVPKNTNSIQSPTSIKECFIIKDAANVFDENYKQQIKIDKKYMNVVFKYEGKELYFKDWNNKEYKLKYQGFPVFKGTDKDFQRADFLNLGLEGLKGNSWVGVLYFINEFTKSGEYLQHKNEPETADFFNSYTNKFMK